MSALTGILQRIRAAFRGGVADREHLDEVQFHLDMLTKRHMERGLSSDEARRRALVEFGGRGDVREAAREARGGAFIDDALRDPKHALRQLRSVPAFTLTTIATIGLAIGAATTVFGVSDHVLLRGMPFPDGDRLVMVWETDRNSGTSREPGSLPDLLDMRARMRTVSSLDAVVGAVGTLNLPGAEPERISAVNVTHGFFETMGVRPIRGRTFTEAEATPGGPQVALISESVWRSRFGAADSIVGAVVPLNEVSTQVIGVMPDDADFGLDQVHDRAAYHATYEGTGNVDAWLPLQAGPQQLPRETHPLLLIGRLAPGAGLEAAADEFTAITADLERQYPSNTARGAFIEPLDDVIFGESRPLLRLLAAAVVLLVLVAAVNVANLLLARGTARAREVALRGALGATPRRLARQFTAEAAVLMTLGAAVGMGVAWAALRVVRAVGPADVPRLNEAQLDARGIAAALVVAAIIGAIFSLLPALTAFRDDPMAVLKGEAGTTTMTARGRRLRDALVVGELALCVALAVCATLVARSFNAVLAVDPGFTASGVVKAQYELPPARYPRNFARFPNFTEINQFSDRLLTAARSLPGVDAAAIAAAHPLDEGFTNSWQVVGRESESANWPEISVRIVSQGYSETMGLAVRSGRTFTAGDDGASPPVALINETAAKRFFASQDPIGQQIRFWGMRRLVVGVVADERIHGVASAVPPATYVPLRQAPAASGVLLVRSTRDPAAMLATVRRVVTSVDPQLAVFGVEPFTATLGGSVGQRRFAMLVMSAFAAITLLLALVGVQGVVAYTAGQRTRELGIRQALGARRGSSVGLLLRGTAGQALAGVVLGTLGAAAGSGLLTKLLFGISRFDPWTFVLVPVLVTAVAMVAALWPAWSAVYRAPLAAIRGAD